MDTIGSLHQLTSADPRVWGNKAATLAQLAAAGFAVPPGVVLPVGPGPGDLDALTAAAHRLGPGPFAVRSSSPEEDLEESSAAGRYTTVLGVGPAGIPDAVAAVRRSGGPRGMAVIVQRQVPASAAGVAFSANPVTGERTEAVVDAVPGLGDKLVGGDVTPEEWTVGTDGVAARRSGDAPVLTAEQAARVAALARAAAEVRGAPQDIEWAMAAEELFLLQSRPITTLVEPVPVPFTVPPGHWLRGATHFPQPQTPFTRTAVDPNPGCLVMSTTLGLPVDLVSATIGGWYYVNVRPVFGPAPQPGRTPPDLPRWLMAVALPVALWASAEGRRRIRAARRLHRSDGLSAIVRAWSEVHQPRVERRLAELHEVDLDALDLPGLAAHLDAALTFVADCLDIHYVTNMPQWIRTAELLQLCRRTLGWEQATTLSLLAGTSRTTSLPSRELARVAAAPPEEQGAATARYLQRFGQRLLSLELADRTYAEVPGLLAAQLAARRYDPDRQEDEAARTRAALTRQARATLRGRDRRRFEELLPKALTAYPVRDDNVCLTVEMPFAVLRYAALAAGRRMVAAGALRTVEDVFFLETGEVLAWLRGEPVDARTLVRRRRGEHAWYLAHPGPDTYGPAPADPPSLVLLPPSLRAVMEPFTYAVQLMLEAELSARSAPTDGESLTGVPASPGTYTGTVRVVRSEEELPRIRSGDVLVCRSTRPSWAVVFGSLGALVADIGGSLSHPAIIAREMRIPAVVATGSATTLLHDGDQVTVDGTTGVVRRVPGATPPGAARPDVPAELTPPSALRSPNG